MKENELYLKGDIYVPVGTPNPEFVLPDDVVAYCANKYGLLDPSKKGIDPMCGVGTIPRVVAAKGGNCDGIEIDPSYYAIAKSEVPKSVTLLHDDCLNAPLVEYDYIYTSPPFKMFLDQPDRRLADAFKKMLKPGGILLIDSIDEVEREGKTWRVAETEITYFTAHGFHCIEALRFHTMLQKDCDNQFTELLFTYKP